MMDCLLPGLSIAGICWKLNGSRPGLNAFVKLSCPICLWRWNLKFQSNHFLMWTFEFWFVRCSRDTSETFSKLVERLHDYTVFFVLKHIKNMVKNPQPPRNGPISWLFFGKVMQLPQLPAAVFEARHPQLPTKNRDFMRGIYYGNMIVWLIWGYIEWIIFVATMIFGCVWKWCKLSPCIPLYSQQTPYPQYSWVHPHVCWTYSPYLWVIML